MLSHRPGAVAADDLAVPVLVKEGSHQGGLGNEDADAFGQGLVGGGPGEIPGEPRTVVAVHPENPAAHHGLGVDGRPHRQIPALGVSPQTELSRVAGGHLGQVVLCQLLGGDGEGEGHAEALLPTHQGVVGPPEGQVQGSVRQEPGEGGELGPGLLVQDALAAAQADLGEAGALRSPNHQPGDLVCHQDARVIPAGLGGESVHCLPKGEGLLGGEAGQDAFQGGIGAHRQDEAVDDAEGSLRKGEMAPFLQIIQAVFPGHGSTSLWVLSFIMVTLGENIRDQYPSSWPMRISSHSFTPPSLRHRTVRPLQMRSGLLQS